MYFEFQKTAKVTWKQIYLFCVHAQVKSSFRAHDTNSIKLFTEYHDVTLFLELSNYW